MKTKLKLTFQELHNEFEVITGNREMSSFAGGYTVDDVMVYLGRMGFNFHDNGNGNYIAYGSEYTGSSETEIFGSSWNDWLMGAYGGSGSGSDPLVGSGFQWLSFESGDRVDSGGEGDGSGSGSEYPTENHWYWNDYEQKWMWSGVDNMPEDPNAPHYSDDDPEVVVSAVRHSYSFIFDTDSFGNPTGGYTETYIMSKEKVEDFIDGKQDALGYQQKVTDYGLTFANPIAGQLLSAALSMESDMWENLEDNYKRQGSVGEVRLVKRVMPPTENYPIPRTHYTFYNQAGEELAGTLYQPY